MPRKQQCLQGLKQSRAAVALIIKNRHTAVKNNHTPRDWRNRLFVRVPLSMPVYFFHFLEWGEEVRGGGTRQGFPRNATMAIRHILRWHTQTQSASRPRLRDGFTFRPSGQNRWRRRSEETMVWNMRTSADVEGHPDIVHLKYMNTAYSDMDQW